MGNLILSIKKIIINKTTVTVFGLILCLVIVFYSYNNRVKTSINPVEVPYAKVKIEAGHQITSDKVGITTVPPSMINSSVITDSKAVIDKYANADTIIPEGSLFYERSVVDKEELPANIILDYPTGWQLYYLPVNTVTSYGNSIYPGNYVSIHINAEKLDETDTTTNSPKQLSGELIENVKVLAVKDKQGQSVFKDPDNPTTPCMIIFAVPEEYYLLLTSASYMRTYNVNIYPVPQNLNTTESDETEASNQEIKNWIKSLTDWKE